MNASFRRVASLAVLLLAALFLVWLLKDLDLGAALQAWAAVPVWVWCLTVCGLCSSHLARAARIHNEWRDHVSLRMRDACCLTVSHSAWVVLAPLRAGEAYYLLALRERYGVGLAEASLSLLRQRVQDLLALGTLATFLLPLPPLWCALLFVAAFATVTFGSRWLWQVLARWVPRLAALSTLDDAPGRHLRRWLFTLANWALKLVALAAPLALVADLSALQALRGAFGGEIAAALPLQPPAGFGPFEAGVWAGAGAFAHNAGAQVVGAALGVHLVALAVTLSLALLARLLGWRLSPAQDNPDHAHKN